MVNFNVKKFRLFSRLILGLAVLIFIWLAVVPSGQITYNYNFRGHNFLGGQGFMRKVWPPANFQKTPNALIIINQPAYFFLLSPRKFNTAIVTLKYQYTGSDDQPIKVGLLLNKLTGAYNWQTIINPLSAGDYKTAILTFDLNKAERNNQQNTFQIIVPGLNTNSVSAANLKMSIKELKIKLSGLNWQQKLYEKFK